MLLENKVAVVHGGWAIDGAVAQVFAGEGARVFLAGRRLDGVQFPIWNCSISGVQVA